jgi:hypothetical protein
LEEAGQRATEKRDAMSGTHTVEEERESELVREVATAGIMAMADAAGDAATDGRFTSGTMLAASMHILAIWMAVESEYMDIDAGVKNVSEQLRRVVESHLDDAFVQDLKTRMRVVETH